MIKVIAKPNLGLSDRLPIPGAEDIAFSRNGKTEYMYVAIAGRNAVEVFLRATEKAPCEKVEAKQTTQSGVSGKNYALVVGINEYNEWPSLRTPANDAADVTDELSKFYGFEVKELPGRKCGNKNCKLTKNELISAIREYAVDQQEPSKTRVYGDEDQLLIYISGHGALDQPLDRGYLVTSDSKLYDTNHISQESQYDLRDILNKIPIKHIFVVIDACYAGSFEPTFGQAKFKGETPDEYTRMSLDELRTRSYHIVTRQFLTSGGADEEVPEGYKRNSPFAEAFLSALRTYGGADHYLTIAKIKPSFATLQSNARQGFFGDDDGHGEFFFVYVPLPRSQVPAAD